MRIVSLSAVFTVPFLFACAGPMAAPATQVVRVDYSHVDGGSCMSGGGRPSLAWKQDWDLSNCPTRKDGPDGLNDACRAAYNAECCTQAGGVVVGWQAHVIGGEKLVSPLCRL